MRSRQLLLSTNVRRLWVNELDQLNVLECLGRSLVESLPLAALVILQLVDGTFRFIFWGIALLILLITDTA